MRALPTAVQVPDAAVMLAETSGHASAIRRASAEAVRSGQAGYDTLPLVLAVLAEKLKGSASKWAPYLGFMPSNLQHLPFQWSVRRRLGACVHLSAEHLTMCFTTSQQFSNCSRKARVRVQLQSFSYHASHQ